MENRTTEILMQFKSWMISEEKAAATVEKYTKAVAEFLAWQGDGELTKEMAIEWKEKLVEENLSPVTVNTKIAALNRYLLFIGKYEFKIRPLKLQRKIFRSDERDLTKDEYMRLIAAAEKMGQIQIALVMETIGSTGIRVSELRYITVETAERGQAIISMKGKVRNILIPAQTRKKLLKYAQKNKITSGEIFLSKGGKSLCRKQIWAKMKIVCRAAGVEASKVFPHNLRHLFAVAYYKICRDVAKLADVLGHSSIETTRIYLISTGKEHMKILEQMRMVI